MEILREWIATVGQVEETNKEIKVDDVNRVTMTHVDFSVCLAALVQAESYWDLQLRLDGDMPGDFSRDEAKEILRSLREVRIKVENILQMASPQDENEDAVVVS